MGRGVIDGSQTVARVLRSSPGASAVFRERGMACPGCAMAPFETLADAAAAYGEELPRLLEGLASLAAPQRSRATGTEGATRPPHRRPNEEEPPNER